MAEGISTKGSNEIPEWVFCNAEGNPLDYYNLKRRHCEKCLDHAGLRRIRFHDLRHTYATLLLMQGESPAYVKEQLGHSSIKVTVDIYCNWIPDNNRQAVNHLPVPSVRLAKTATKNATRRQKRRPGENPGLKLLIINGADESRTRDLRRDRPAF